MNLKFVAYVFLHFYVVAKEGFTHFNALPLKTSKHYFDPGVLVVAFDRARSGLSLKIIFVHLLRSGRGYEGLK